MQWELKKKKEKIVWSRGKSSWLWVTVSCWLRNWQRFLDQLQSKVNKNQGNAKFIKQYFESFSISDPVITKGDFRLLVDVAEKCLLFGEQLIHLFFRDWSLVDTFYNHRKTTQLRKSFYAWFVITKSQKVNSQHKCRTCNCYNHGLPVIL